MGAQSREPGPRESRRRASAQRFGRGSGPSAERRAARCGTAAWDDEPPSAEERVAARLAQVRPGVRRAVRVVPVATAVRIA